MNAVRWVLPLAVISCGGQTEVAPPEAGAVQPEDATATDGPTYPDVAAFRADSATADVAPIVPFADASCDQASPGGDYTCCNGHPCRGACVANGTTCDCGNIWGGCWGDAVCCDGLACALPSTPTCNYPWLDASAPPNDGSLPIIDGGEPYPVVDAGGTCVPRSLPGPTSCCGGVPCVGFCVTFPDGHEGCDCYGIQGGCQPGGSINSNGPMCCGLGLFGCASFAVCTGP